MCTTTLENYFPYYNFTNGVKFIHFILMPVILFGSIFSLTEIPVHYNPYNLTDIAQKTNISDITQFTFNGDLWKAGFDFNVATICIGLFFMFYLLVDFVSSITFLIEGTFLWYVSNIINFVYKVQNNYLIWVYILLPSIACLICLYLMHVCCIKTSEPFNTICYFPLIILFLPLFTIFNVFHSLCGHKLNIGVNYYNNEGSSSGPNYNSV